MKRIKPLLTETITLPRKRSQRRWKELLKFPVKHKIATALLLMLAIAIISFLRAQDAAVFNFMFGKESNLEEQGGRVNVLLLGIGGGSHDGPNLTDTIMVASYDLTSHKASLVSLPRDLWFDDYKAKVNTLYQLGINKGDGLGLAREDIGKILGINIPYAVRVDFKGFVKAVDLVEGVDIEVEHSFDDYVYPLSGKEDDLCGHKEDIKDISSDQAKTMGVEPGQLKVLIDKDGNIATSAANPKAELVYTDNQALQWFSCRFEHLQFKKGPLHLDGETALKFVRSRHGTNGENSDFARSKRQQLVLQAFRAKILSLNTLTDPGKIVSLIQTFGSSIDTNIPQNKYLEFAKLIRQMESTKSYVIDESGDNPFLITPPVGKYGSWVLIPPGNDFSRIQKFIGDVFADNPEATLSTMIKQPKPNTVESNINP